MQFDADAVSAAAEAHEKNNIYHIPLMFHASIA
jgi:hypothetical protein